MSYMGSYEIKQAKEELKQVLLWANNHKDITWAWLSQRRVAILNM